MSDEGRPRSILAWTALAISTIAAVSAAALGGGCEFVMACDLVYAGPEAKIGQIEVLGGVIPGFGGSWRLAQRVGLSRVMEMIFTAEVVSAVRAKELGIVLDVFPANELLGRCKLVAERISATGRDAVSAAKRVLIAGAGQPFVATIPVEQEAFSSLFGPEQQRRMKAFLAQRKPSKGPAG